MLLIISIGPDALDVLQAILPFFGGLAAVLLGMILRVYRTDSQRRREILNTIDLTSKYAEGSLTELRSEENRKKVAERVEEVYVEYDYLLTSLGSHEIEGIIFSLDRYENPDEMTKIWKEIGLDFEIDSTSRTRLELWSEEPDKDSYKLVRDVTIRGAMKRFFGFDEAYEERSEVKYEDLK